MTRRKPEEVNVWFIRIQVRPVGLSYKQSLHLDWPILFRDLELAHQFFETCFTFKNLEKRFPRERWRMSAALRHRVVLKDQVEK